MLPSEQRNARFLALVWCGTLAVNYPLISLLSDATILFGFPVLILYLFLIWCGFILLVALVMAVGHEAHTDVGIYGDNP